MLYALDQNNEKIQPEQGTKATCPCCGGVVIACIGELIYPYWRHEANTHTDCIVKNDKGSEGYWHSTWKYLYGKKYAEVSIQKGDKKRIADVQLPNGLVIEIQHSPISTKEIRARESFYQKIVWIFDGTGPFAGKRLSYGREDYEWVLPRQSIIKCQCPIFIDVGYDLLIEIKSIEKISKLSKNKDFNKLIYVGKCVRYTKKEFMTYLSYVDESINYCTLFNSFTSQYSKLKSKNTIIRENLTNNPI